MTLLMLLVSLPLLKELSGFPTFYRRVEMKLWLAFSFEVSMLDFLTAVILLECSESEFPKNEKLRILVKEG